MNSSKKNEVIARLDSAKERVKQTSQLDKYGMIAIIEALCMIVDECVKSETEWIEDGWAEIESEYDEGW